MTTQRRDLRQACVAILTNQGRAPYPTMAGENVFDSKGDEIVHHADQEQLPTVLVYTDTMVGDPDTLMNSWPPTFVVELVIELAMSTDKYRTETDAELEARLDEFEQQVMNLLFDPAPDSLGLKFRKLYSKFLSYRSLRMGNSKNNERLAMRGIVVELEVGPRCKNYETMFGPLETIGFTIAHDKEELSADIKDLQA